MKRRIVDLLRPEQVPKYTAALWLVSHADEDRRSGRTVVLAAAHLTEAIRSGSSRIWDHAVQGVSAWTTMVGPHVESMAQALNLENVKVEGGVVRLPKRQSDAYSRAVLGSEAEIATLTLRESVRTAVRKGVPEEVIMGMVEKALSEGVVDEVHDL